MGLILPLSSIKRTSQTVMICCRVIALLLGLVPGEIYGHPGPENKEVVLTSPWKEFANKGSAVIGDSNQPYRLKSWVDETREKRDNRRMCGDNLMMMLFLACGYSSPSQMAGLREAMMIDEGLTQKRSSFGSYEHGLYDDSIWNEVKGQVAGYAGGRSTGGLAERCCRSSCSIHQLRVFC